MTQPATETEVVAQAPRKPLKIAVLIPFYRFMDGKAVESLIAMMADIHSRGDIYVPVICQNIFIESARAFLLKGTVEHVPDADYVLCLDTDHVYSATALYGLIDAMEANDLEWLSAAYACRGVPNVYAHLEGSKKIKMGTVSGIVRCDVVGFGFLVMRMRFMKHMWAKYGNTLFARSVVDGKIHVGDDVRFSELAAAEGHKPAFHAGIKVGHLSQVVL